MREPLNWYQLEADEIFRNLDASESGLSDDEARQRLARFGPNKLAEAEKISRFRILLHQFTSPLIYILLIAGAVTIVLKEYTDAGVIFAVVILNAIIGFTQEYKAEESVRALRKLTVPRARAVRNGREQEINSEELVAGDVVVLASGSKVPVTGPDPEDDPGRPGHCRRGRVQFRLRAQ
jgi:Ca2+-transporting ATPase